jgi:hypothetical protein
MKGANTLRIFLAVLALGLCFWHPASADVAPGDVIDKTNWEKAEELLPGAVLDWVKKGDFVFNIGELNYNPADYFPPQALKSLETNVGKYDLDENDGIIDVKMEKLPKFIEGIPFPKIDPNDPKAGQKVLYNEVYNVFSMGGLRHDFFVVWLGRAGFEREVEGVMKQLPLDGYPPARERPNPDQIQNYNIFLVKNPVDLAGTAVMGWRYRAGTVQDLNFAYVPAIRRVRRTSPANRSDAFVGSDACVDDAMGYDGKIPAFDWKVMGQQEALFPFLKPDPERIVKNEMEEWVSTPDVAEIEYGYQKEGWQGAPWAPTNLVWAKRPAWVILAQPKDRYYNYGDQHLWVDAETFFPIYKVVHDRAGKYWKTFIISTAGSESADKEMRFMLVSSQQSIDDRRQHSTYVEDASPRNEWAQFVDLDENDFSLAGFQKYCK